MNLEFNIYELKEDSKQYNALIEKSKSPNNFIIVGEEKDWYKAHMIDDRGLCLIDGLTVDEFSLLIDKNDLQIKTNGFSREIMEMDIPKKYLTINIIENIQRLNT
ncbi:MAG: hypothetical protein LLF98_02665 [Clostridium sp.]|uniref:hypothetical protein n=1 Tax=Clostridium sp. TaxID=1506 RepID=UPI0025C23BB4|nr:hypothetical protein [Clostridium sp.]MCE5220186.1 hypothetical protein [Clostridium sp.]